MKMVIAVIQDQDARKAADALVAGGFRSTRLSSTGGFLRAGNTTLLIGVEDKQVEEVCQIIRNECEARTQIVNPITPMASTIESFSTFPVEVVVGGAIIFVIDVERFERA
ncbi:MAG: cyclic-di-AMP receptor [Negativicutes bacterium]|nr:cyclic-di-AMP receptor [Negativicutes bacterium]